MIKFIVSNLPLLRLYYVNNRPLKVALTIAPEELDENFQ